jgi:hypothetical protein
MEISDRAYFDCALSIAVEVCKIRQILVGRAGLFKSISARQEFLALSCRAKPSGDPTSARRKPAPTVDL